MKFLLCISTSAGGSEWGTRTWASACLEYASLRGAMSPNGFGEWRNMKINVHKAIEWTNKSHKPISKAAPLNKRHHPLPECIRPSLRLPSHSQPWYLPSTQVGLTRYLINESFEIRDEGVPDSNTEEDSSIVLSSHIGFHVDGRNHHSWTRERERKRESKQKGRLRSNLKRVTKIKLCLMWKTKLIFFFENLGRW